MIALIQAFLKRIFQSANFWSLVFIVFLIAISGSVNDFYNRNLLRENFENLNIGGPVVNLEKEAAFVTTSGITGEFQRGKGQIPALDSGTVMGVSNSLTNIVEVRGGLKRYSVRVGDNLSNIAAQFGISLETLREANGGLGSSIRSGQELVILPVSGALYEVKEGDSLEAVASRYEVNQGLIKQYNADYQKLFNEPGSLVVLPYVKNIKRISSLNRLGSRLPDLKSYFVLPVQGWNWGVLHEINAVDIANRCGAPVYAAAEGLVVPDESLGDGLSGWNNGYGLFVFIEHPNGTKSRYAHLGKVTVRIGDYVSQGEEVGLIGNTGNTHGPTGCHLHFEVYGAKNPFALK
ncbi:MAG: peptidoglycan DD-metalloendopeptidase family protein [Patescibacteria group bacterium]|nr:peptidoglycan DD-metalloendopeptidase family protein [Patescibacteria group bacterium]